MVTTRSNSVARLFQVSKEKLTGSRPIQGLQYYLHEDVQGTEPSVDSVSAPPPGTVAIYRTTVTDSTSLEQLGEAARSAIDTSLPQTGAVLLRGIPARTPEEFSSFKNACKNAPSSHAAAPWKETPYINIGRPRQKLGGVDRATNIPPELVLNTHNEMSYNPIRPSRVCLYCVQPSQAGGENTIAKNVDLTKLDAAQTLMKYFDNHGGILYERSYHDANATNNNNPDQNGNNSALSKQLTYSWQEKCGCKTRGEAEQYWINNGFKRENIVWEKDGTMRVRNIESGYIIAEDDVNNNGNNSGDKNNNNTRRLWFNNIDTTGVCADGSGRPPPELTRQFQADRWSVTYSFKLEAGDWLVLDNNRVQHGRLPYPTGGERCLLTVLTA